MRPSIPLSLLALLPLCLGSACTPAPTESREPTPVLVFAIDGFEWSVILPLLRAGEMPHLAALMERGTFGELKTLVPTKSPRLWTTIATGKPPAEHGILDFVKEQEDPSLPEQHYTSYDRRTKAFWNILSEAGVTNDTIGWWVTYP